MKGGRRWVWIVGLLAVGALSRAAYTSYVYLKPSTVPLAILADPDGYGLMARHLVGIRELSVVSGQPLTGREPFYPFLLAGSYVLFGTSPVVGLVLNQALGLLACWLIFLLTESVFRKQRVALLALAFACFYPEWIYYGAFLYRETLVTVLLLLWAYLWASSGETPSPGPYILMGLSFGAIAITRSPMTPLGLVFLLMAGRRLKPVAWPRTLGLFLLCACLLQVPWIWRNYRLMGRFVAGSSMGGSVMYLSIQKDYAKPEEALEKPMLGQDPVFQEMRARGLTVDQAEPMFYRACWDIFIHQPGKFWKAFACKALKLWRPFPNPGWEYAHSYAVLRAVGLISTGSLMILGALGAWWAWRARFRIGFLLMVPAVMTIIYGLFWAVTRYHSPLMAGWIPLAAFAAARLLAESTEEESEGTR